MSTDTATVIPTAPRIKPDEAARLARQGQGWIVDVREADEHRREHVAGASLFPTSVFSVTGFPAQQAGQRMLVLCRSGKRAGKVVDALRAAGRTDVCVIEGGITGWSKAGLPVVRNATAPMPLSRQVMVCAGLLVVAFTALAVLVNPWFMAGTGFVGLGLTFAGITGICTVATILAKMPWNRATAALPASNTTGSSSCSTATAGRCCS
jgi:rhodanese-related sulfurtransferase